MEVLQTRNTNSRSRWCCYNSCSARYTRCLHAIWMHRGHTCMPWHRGLPVHGASLSIVPTTTLRGVRATPAYRGYLRHRFDLFPLVTTLVTLAGGLPW